jgi:hypothetical protein
MLLHFSFFTRFCAFNYISFGFSQPQGNEFMIKNALDIAFENMEKSWKKISGKMTGKW